MTIKQTDTIAALAALFPQALAVPGHLRRPLKVGVFQDLVVRTAGVITLADLHRAIGRYTGCAAYLKASQSGAPRIDLDGNPSGEVTPVQAESARARLEGLECRQAARAKPVHAATAAAPAAVVPTAPPRSAPRRLGLAELRAAAQQRRGVTDASHPRAWPHNTRELK